MSLWLILLIVGAILMIAGFAGVGQFVIYIGIAVLLIALVLNLTGRRSGV